jgi:alanyl-tRNA synthetase
VAALDYVRQTEQALLASAAVLKIPPKEVPERVAALAKEIRDLKKQGGVARSEGVSADMLLADAVVVHGTKVVVVEVKAAQAPVLRGLIDQLRKAAAPIAVLLASPQEEGKVMLMAGLSRDLVQRGLDAVVWVRSAATIVGGSGGGRPDMAQAGGKDASKISEALQAARSSIQTMLAP